MKILIASFTRSGAAVCQTLFYGFLREGHDCQAFGMPKYAAEFGLTPMEVPLRDWCAEGFRKGDALIFVGACGIAIRGIAPFVKDKREDPAVVVADEKGNFVVSLLSGHIGGANELAVKVAALTGGVPVVTTATDVNGLFAVDVFARQNRLVIESMPLAKAVSAALLDGEKVGFASAFPVDGEIPGELSVWENQGDFLEPEGPQEDPPCAGLGIAVTIRENMNPWERTLRLYPKLVSIGIGCRRGTPLEKIEEKALKVLELGHIPLCALSQAASIDLKKDEAGIVGFCRKYGLPYRTWTAEELGEAPGEFSPSGFVASVTGVDNVCERAAVLASDGGTLIQKKFAGDGVTIALALKKWRVCFE